MSVGYVSDETLYDYHSMREPLEYIRETTDHPLPLATVPEMFIFTRELRTVDNTRRFEELADTWEAETQYVSSVTQIVLHPNYQRIIGMGPEALPLIFARFQRQPQHWFWALRAISGEDPVRREHAGNVREMTAAWMTWARQRGYLG